jgi:outer membrane protein insertion porin family
MKIRLTAFLVMTGLANLAQAVEPFIIKDIRVEGIQRTEAGTVFSYLPVKVGDRLDDEKASAAIKALFATGFFKDVRLEAQGDVLIVTVEERPAVAKIKLGGIKEFSEDELKKSLKDAGLAEGRIFDKSLLDRAVHEMKSQYFNKGKYAVEINTTVTPLERNRVSIDFNVVEGASAKIRQINLVGNKAFTEKKLLGQFSSSTPGWLSWFTDDDQYSKTKLAGDLENLRSFYLNQGYLEFNIDSTQVSISPDKKDIYITVNMTEGPKYTVSDVKLAGQMLVPEAEIRKLIYLKPGDVFSRQKLTESTKLIGDRLGKEGYAFANVNAVPELDKIKHQVAFTLYIDPGHRVYVDRINVSGNSKTRDEVIRREVRQMEGAWYNSEKIQLSQDRLNRLGYFDNVSLETPMVSGTTDQVDLNINVTEKATGNILVGAGFSSSDGLILSGSINQSNVFGTGNQLGVQINSGKVNRVYSLSFTNPYYTLDGVSLGYDIYRRDVDSTSLSGVGQYRSSTMGAGMRFGLPLNEKNYLNLGLAGELFDVTTDSYSPITYQNFENTFGNRNTTLRFTSSVARDTRNSFLFPTKGFLQSIGLEAGIPPGDLQYYRINAQHQQFIPIGSAFTLMINGEAGYGAGLGGKPLPFFKNFFAGGVSSVRGFDSGTIGPKGLSPQTATAVCNGAGAAVPYAGCNKVALGGDIKVLGNIELFAPMPGIKDGSVRISTFLDAGAVFGASDYLGRSATFNFSDFRYSAGVGLAWNSPMGPLKFSLAKPLKKQVDDKTQLFQFNLGTTF